MGRAGKYALAAGLALVVIDIAEVVLDGDCAELADRSTFAAAYAGVGAGLPCNSALVLVHAANPYAPLVLWHCTLVANLDDVLRAGLCAGAAGRTFGLVDLREACLRVHMDGAELAGSHTVATAETAICAAYSVVRGRASQLPLQRTTAT